MFRQVRGYTRLEPRSYRSVGVVSVGIVVVLFALAVGATGTVAAQSAPDCSTVTYPGNGTESDPYEVGNVDQLQCVNSLDLDANYTQVSEIDASDTSSWNGGDGFEPIGGQQSPVPTPFTGTYDGQGYNITDLTIDRSAEVDVGMFGFVAAGAEVTNVAVVDADITGATAVGGLVGTMGEGTVSESFTSGSVGEPNGAASGGGLVGINSDEGAINESYSTATVESTAAAGGLVGGNDGTIEKSYARGSVDGTIVAGGLVGANGVNAMVDESYATGSVSGGTSPPSPPFSSTAEPAIDTVGGLIGNNSGTATDSYWDTQTTGQPDSDGGTGLTTAEMTGSAATSNMQGFDFANTWETVLGDYPVLAWQTEDDNAAPTASFTFSPSSPSVSDTVMFDASGSSDSDGTIQTYEWDFGDGTTATGRTATHSFPAPGDYNVALTVTDDGGATNTTTQTVSVSGGGGADATVESGSVRVGGTGERGESAITVDADDGMSIARLNVSVDTSVAEITDVSAGADVDTSSNAVTFDVIDQTNDSARIEYSNLQAQASPVEDFELAVVEFEAQTDDGETPIQVLVDQLRDGNTDPYGAIDENEGTFSVGAALFPDPLPGFNAPPQNTGELDPNLYEDVSGDGDGLDPTQSVNLWTELVLNPQDFNDLTQEQIDALDWNGDGSLSPADAVNLWTEQVLTQ